MTPELNRDLVDHAPGSADSVRLTHGQWMTLLAAFLGWMFDGFEMGIFPLVARPALADMGYSGEVGKWMGYVTALFLLGAAGGGLVFGWLGDRIGRVRAMSLSILTYSVFSGCCYFATEPWHLGALRFLSALGMGGEWSLGVALVMECWPERFRPWLAAAIGAASNVGFALIAVVGLVHPITTAEWRWVMLVGAAPALLTFFIRLFVPESERWKESVSASVSRPLSEIFSPALLKTTILAISFASVALIGTWGSVQWAPLWADQMTGGTVPHAKAMTGLVSGIGAIFGCIAGPLLGSAIGRRPTYFCLCLLSLLTCGFLFRAFDEYGAEFLLTVGVVGACTASFYGWLPLYLPELFPTRVRATGQGISYNFGRILAAAGALAQGSLVGYFGGSFAKAGAIVTLIYVIGMVLIWLAPETRGKPLPD
ncbi:MAG TPA: MFS transporter [Planctomycetaceae bacterium]|nr:MFS transporter [Planctomycetaceae bacterium]